MAKTTMLVETLIYKDVRGKELMYLRITNNKNEEVLINVGDKTYKSVEELITGKPQTEEQPKITKIEGVLGK